ncbi:MAG: DUF1573 domain-containing protein [Prevotellaceae bacterium]|jgi:hypothetical protein|nr:DUF1573 domain-containing protein [Prevotellaceae bacterium]
MSKNLKQTLLSTLLALFASLSNAQIPLLQEDFKQNTANTTTPQAEKTLGSGIWQFYYTDKNYNSITQCAVLKYNSSTTGYIITPALAQPATLTFDARTVGNTSNHLEIQKSINGAAFTTVENISISGANYQQYTVAINETNADVRLKFLRGKPVQDGSNYNIIIDNIQVAANNAPHLQLSNGKYPVERNKTFCLDCSNGISYIDIPFTLYNTGGETLILSNIETLACTTTETLKFPIHIMPGKTIDIQARINCTGEYADRSFLVIHSNSADCRLFALEFNRIIP